MDTDSFIVHVKTIDIYEDIAKDVEKGFDTSDYEDQKISYQKKTKQKNHWLNEKSNRWKNHERICGNKSKSIYLFNKLQE